MFHLLSSLRSRILRAPRTPGRCSRKRGFAPHLERLEDRRLLATTLQVRLEQVGFAPLTITDGDPLDSNSAAGVITYVGGYGTFDLNVVTPVSKPASGGITTGELDLSSFSMSSTRGGTLTITLVDTDFDVPGSGSNPLTLRSEIGGNVTGPAGSSVTFQSWANANNASPLAGPTTIPPGSATPGPLGPFTTKPFSGSGVTTFTRGAGPYSLFAQTTITLAGAGSVGFDAFTIVTGSPALAALGDFVWEDSNANGVQDAGEPGIPNVTVKLLDSTGTTVLATTTTDGNGLYLFGDLTPGTYTVMFVAPAGYVVSPKDQGSDDAADSDADAVSGMTGQYTLVSGQTDLTVDAGLFRKAALGDFVWEDNNANGIQDAGEPGIPNVTVKLLDSTGMTVLATTTTDAGGLYLFSDLTPGTYTVMFVPPSGYVVSPKDQGLDDATDSDAETTTGMTGTYTLVSSQTDLSVDAGLFRKAALGDFVWEDTNANGIQDAGEPGIPNVTVKLLDSTGTTVLATTTTDGNGLYLFSDLTPGTYTVMFVSPAGYVVSPKDQGANDAVDSDADAVTGMTGTYTLASGETNLTVDAGYYRLATIGDFVWLDDNANGIQDGGEPGVAGATVQLFTSGNVQVGADQVTGANGLYLFTDLTPGDYYVKVTPPAGYAFTSKDVGGNDAIDSDADTTTGQMAVTTLVSGEDDRTWDAGLVLLTSGIDIEKTTTGPTNTNPMAPDYDNEDAANGPGVPVLTPGSTVTWTYKVTNTGSLPFAFNDIVIVDDNGTPANTSDDLSTTDGDITFLSVQTGDADDVLEPGEVWLYEASGTVLDLGTPTGGSTTFTFSGSTATDGPNGNVRTYTSGSTSVKVSAFSRDRSNGEWSTAYLGSYSGGLGVTDDSEGTGGSNTHTVDNVGRDNYVLFEFSEKVIVDSSVLGYVVDDSDLTVWIGTVTDVFNNHLTLSDAVLASLGFTEVNLTDLASARTADLNAGNVSGNVLVIAAWTEDDTPEDRFKINKVVVKKPVQGTYENKATVTVPGDSDSDLSHYENPTSGSIGGVKYHDLNGNGTRDPGEPGLSGWVIYLDADNDGCKDAGERYTVTTADGSYVFNNLPADTYVVREVMQCDWHQSEAPGPITLSSGESVTDALFGNYQKGKISGYKFNDKNGDGEWDKNGLDNCWGTSDDEVGLQNWKIFLDLDGDGRFDSNEPYDYTDCNGYYSFSNLRPGTYAVREVQQSGWIRTTDNPTVTLNSGQCVTNVNFGNFKGNLIMEGDTATIGFWHNNNGQCLLKSLNGGSTSKALGNWLASNFPKLFGSQAGSNNLTNKTNAQVAAHFQTLFGVQGMKLEAQILATAFAVYVTSSNLSGGDYAADYGFNVTAAGVGGDKYNIGTNGAAFGVVNDSLLSVMDILKRANDRASNGTLYANDQTLRSKANAVFSGINQSGDIPS